MGGPVLMTQHSLGRDLALVVGVEPREQVLLHIKMRQLEHEAASLNVGRLEVIVDSGWTHLLS